MKQMMAAVVHRLPTLEEIGRRASQLFLARGSLPAHAADDWLQAEYALPLSKKVLVFGTFDELNPGHVRFLERAKQFGDVLIVLVPEDRFVVKYKGKPPLQTLRQRINTLRNLPLKPHVFEEDIRENWESLRGIRPEVIVLSAEQAGWRDRLAHMLQEYLLPTKIEVLPEMVP
jgi:cytidyltransferase-like protein